MTGDAQYNTFAIRELLLAAFTSEMLHRFCLDRPLFRPVVAEFGAGQGLAAMVDKVIGFCQTQLLFDELLAEVNHFNPRQYARFEPSLGIAGPAMRSQVLTNQPQPAHIGVIVPEIGKREQLSGRGELGGTHIGNDAGRDKTVHGDEITITGVGAGAAVAAGRGASASVSRSPDRSGALSLWRAEMEAKIEDLPDLLLEDKQDAKEQVARIEQEVAKGEQASTGRLGKLISTLGVIAPEMLEVAIATLAKPLVGTGLVVKKTGDKVRVEWQAADSARPPV
jgi:hypothetical protein